MPRGRIVFKNIVMNPEYSKLTSEELLFLIIIEIFADSEGRIMAEPEYIKGVCFPIRKNMNIPKIERIISKLTKEKFVIHYTSLGVKYIEISGFKERQKRSITREGKSDLPAPNNIIIENKENPKITKEVKIDILPDSIVKALRLYKKYYYESSAGVNNDCKSGSAVKQIFTRINQKKLNGDDFLMATKNYLALELHKGTDAEHVKRIKTFINQYHDYTNYGTYEKYKLPGEKKKEKKIETEEERWGKYTGSLTDKELTIRFNAIRSKVNKLIVEKKMVCGDDKDAYEYLGIEMDKRKLNKGDINEEKNEKEN